MNTKNKHYKNALILDIELEKEKNQGKSTTKTPFEHQKEAHNAMSKFFKNEKCGILVLPTGAGKTFTAAYWLLQHIVENNCKVLWLADQSTLLEQAYETFRNNILILNRRKKVKMRIVSGSGNTNHEGSGSIEKDDDILFITAQTAISNWQDKSEDTKGNSVITPFENFLEAGNNDSSVFVVYDEAHHTPAFGRRNFLIGGSKGKTGILEKYPDFKLLGLTATPTYTDTTKRGWLGKIFTGGIIHESKKDDLQNRDILAYPDYQKQKTDFSFNIKDSDVERIMLKHQELPLQIIKEIADKHERNDYIARFYCENISKFGKTIIFADRWYQCERIEKYINEYAKKEIAASVFSQVDMNKNVNYINQRTADQNQINLEKFRTGELEVLINVKMLTEGVDVPDVKSVFITRETNSTILFTQMVGRALRGKRTGGNKTTANIVLFADNWDRHIAFASFGTTGGTADEAQKERGYRPYELINIDLINRIEFANNTNDFSVSLDQMLPNGWYVVNYSDVFVDEGNVLVNQGDEVFQTFYENVLIYDHEVAGFKTFIEEFVASNTDPLWEKESLNEDEAKAKAQKFINKYFPEKNNNEVLLIKLIQVSRHLGQQKSEPEFFSFAEKNQCNISRFVNYVLERRLDPFQIDDYLRKEFNLTENRFLKSIYSDFDRFHVAYNHEMERNRRLRNGTLDISDSDQSIKRLRLAKKDIRDQVQSRDGHKCLCCGSKKYLEIDHIIAHKHDESRYEGDGIENYQTLCSTCNKDKNTNQYDFFTKGDYIESKTKIRNVSTSSNPVKYLTRLINSYFVTNAVQKDTVKAKDNGNSIWILTIKLNQNGESFLPKLNRDKSEIIKLIRSKGFKFNNIEFYEK